jgi:hypothetical protein
VSEGEDGGGVGPVLEVQVGVRDAVGMRHPRTRMGADGEDGKGRGEGGCQS